MGKYTVRKFDINKDILPLAHEIYGKKGESLVGQIRGLRYICQRWPSNSFVVEDNGRIFGVLILGWQKPELLLRFFGKFSICCPEIVYRWLVKLRIIRDFEVANLHISEDYRGKGRMGIKLLQLAEQEASQRWGQKSIYLLVRESDERTIKVCKHLGYHVVGQHLYWLDKMRKRKYKLKMKKILRFPRSK